MDGKIGVFPDNFVKLLSTSTPNTNATPPGQIVTSKLSPANKPSTTNEVIS